MKTMKKQGRQGDVLVTVVDTEATGKEVEREEGKIVLAHGEATGHAHSISAMDVTLFMDEKTLARHLDTRGAESPILDHQEHEAFQLPSDKTIEVVRQMEYRPERLIRVAD